MKISLGVNYFGHIHRQELAKQTHLKLQSMFPGAVQLYNLQFANAPLYEPIKDAIYYPELHRSSKNFFPGWEKELPLVNDCFEAMSETDCDYFIFTNSDVLISDRLIKFIIEKEPTCFACSRLDIEPIQTLDDPMKPYRWEIGGFDTYIFRKSWYLQYKFLFEDFFLGRPWYDHHYAGLMKVFGGNVEIGNKNPAFCVHLHHGWGACTDDNPGYTFNAKHFNESPFRKFDKPWDDYWRDILRIRRTPTFYFLNEYENERSVERDFFEKAIKELEPDIKKIREQYNII